MGHREPWVSKFLQMSRKLRCKKMFKDRATTNFHPDSLMFFFYSFVEGRQCYWKWWVMILPGPCSKNGSFLSVIFCGKFEWHGGRTATAWPRRPSRQHREQMAHILFIAIYKLGERSQTALSTANKDKLQRKGMKGNMAAEVLGNIIQRKNVISQYRIHFTISLYVK